eukprot:7036968-Pyramimonas_sp.AAC.1
MGTTRSFRAFVSVTRGGVGRRPRALRRCGDHTVRWACWCAESLRGFGTRVASDRARPRMNPFQGVLARSQSVPGRSEKAAAPDTP